MTASCANLRRKGLLIGCIQDRQHAGGNRQQLGSPESKISKTTAVRMINSYKDLIVWQRGMDLVEAVYQITAKLPVSEQWGLISQMRRSAVSVPSNIAEGYGRQATGEYRHHLSIGRGSLLELETQLILCRRLGYMELSKAELISREIEEISIMLAALISKIA